MFTMERSKMHIIWPRQSKMNAAVRLAVRASLI